MVSEFEAGITSVTSSAYVTNAFPIVTHCKSDELMMKSVEPRAEPWTTLELMPSMAEETELNLVRWTRFEKKSSSQL